MDGLHSLLFWANPAPENRVPLDFSNLYLLALPFPTLLLQVHLLLRYPLTSLNRLLRILLIFPSIILASRAGFGHRFKLNDEQGSTLQAYNVALGVYVAFAAAKTIEWGLMNQRPRLRGSGKKKGVVSADSAPSIQNGSSSQIKIDSNQNRNPSTTSRSRTSSSVSKTNTTSSTSKPSDELLPLLFPGSWVPLELDLLASMRGLGWEFGIDSKAGYGRKTWTLEQRMNFIWGRVGNSLVGIFSMDLLDSLMKHPRINPAGRVGGGSLWESEAGILGKAGPPACEFREKRRRRRLPPFHRCNVLRGFPPQTNPTSSSWFSRSNNASRLCSLCRHSRSLLHPLGHLRSHGLFSRLLYAITILKTLGSNFPKKAVGLSLAFIIPTIIPFSRLFPNKKDHLSIRKKCLQNHGNSFCLLNFWPSA